MIQRPASIERTVRKNDNEPGSKTDRFKHRASQRIPLIYTPEPSKAIKRPRAESELSE
jgi:hypothetical protein